MTLPQSTRTVSGALPDLNDIQGNIVRGYRMGFAIHFALMATNGGGARRFLGGLVTGGGGASPLVTTAAEWGPGKPPYCLNVSLTWKGLRAVGLPPSILALFPASFQAGPDGQAKKLGDDGPSDPTNWTMGGPRTAPVHIIVSLYAQALGALAVQESRLAALFARDGLREVWRRDATALADGKVHFGYRDSIAQPRLKGLRGTSLPDRQPEAEPGEFLLGKGYVNQYCGNFIGALPPELADNATYAALRMLQQDVVAFNTFITSSGERSNMSPEMVAAKLMGRWYNGMPLTMSPTTPNPATGPSIPPHQINNFDFAPNADDLTYFNDDVGLRCPVGAHIRRLNPRSAVEMGKPHTRRIIRRAMPYGPLYDPTKRPDGQERGLIGYFICGDLEMQFEFLQSTWVNGDFSTIGIQNTRDPLIGAHPTDVGGRFVLRTGDGRDPIVFNDLPRFVETRGSAYCFIPGIGGLRFLAGI